MSKQQRITWRSSPLAPRGYSGAPTPFPLAAVVWMPDGPALATVAPLARVEPPMYVGRINDREATGRHASARACRDAVAVVVAMAHDAAFRRMRDADF